MLNKINFSEIFDKFYNDTYVIIITEIINKMK